MLVGARLPDSRHDRRALLSAIGVAGMNRMIQANVIAMRSGRAVEAAGDVDVSARREPAPSRSAISQAYHVHCRPTASTTRRRSRRRAASSFADETPEGRSIVVSPSGMSACASATSMTLGRVRPVLAQTPVSGVDMDSREVRKGTADAVEAYVRRGRSFPEDATATDPRNLAAGRHPLVVADDSRSGRGSALKDIVRGRRGALRPTRRSASR